MYSTHLRVVFTMVICLLAGQLAQATELPLAELDDTQLADVYAAGFDISIDFDLDLATSDPDSVFIGPDQITALQQLSNQLSTASLPLGQRSRDVFDGQGAYIPSIDSVINNITNTLNMSDNAMQNAQSLVNIIAMNGDVAVGMNLNIVVNPGETPFTITQTNINWSNIDFQTLVPTPSIPQIP